MVKGRIFKVFMKYVYEIHKRLSNLPVIWFIIMMLVLMWGLTFLLSFTTYYFFPSYTLEVKNTTILDNIVAVFLAPPLETLLFQYLIINILQKITKLRLRYIILISSIIFSIVHYSSVYSVIFAFLMGFILAYSYAVYQNKKESAFWVTTLIHALKNLPIAIYLTYSVLQ